MSESKCEKSVVNCQLLGRYFLISEGMRLQHLGLALESNEAVLVQFTLRGETFSVCGRAVRSSPLDGIGQEAGLSFSGLDGRTRERLRSCLVSPGSPI